MTCPAGSQSSQLRAGMLRSAGGPPFEHQRLLDLSYRAIEVFRLNIVINNRDNNTVRISYINLTKKRKKVCMCEITV